MIEHTQNLHKSIYDIAELGWYKENSAKFKKIITELQNTENAVIGNMSQIAKEFFIEQNILLDSVLHLCSKEDIVLLYRLYIGETRNDIASLFHIKTHTLTQRVSRLKEKLKPLLSETEYEAFFH